MASKGADDEPFASDEEEDEQSLPEFSASEEDEWAPEKAAAECSPKKRGGGRKAKTTVAKRVPPRATRASRRIAIRLGKELSPEREEEVLQVVPSPNPTNDEEGSSSSSSEEEEEEEESKKKVARRKKGRPAPAKKKRGRKPKPIIKDAPIKLTTFTVEELYRKYRPDLACPKMVEAAKQHRKEHEPHHDDGDDDDDDESSGDDYLVDPEKLDLNSEFFNRAEVPQSEQEKKETKSVEFDCNAGIVMTESDDDGDGEEEIPLSSVAKQEASCDEFNRKLIQQINQSSQDCMNIVKLVEVSKRIERERKEMERIRSEREKKEVKEEDVSNLLLAGEKIKAKPSTSAGRNDFVAVNNRKDIVKEEEKTVEITLKFETTDQKGKKEKKKIDVLTAIKRLMNREKRQNQIHLHKVSILCWIAHGTFLNRTISNPSLVQCTVKRLLPSASPRPKGLTNLHYFVEVTRYFRKVVKLKNTAMYFRTPNKLPPLKATLKYQILQRSAFSKRDYILLFLLMLRSLNIHCRLVMSLVVPPKLIPSSELYRMNPQTRDDLEADRRLLRDFQRAPRRSTLYKVREKLAAMLQKNTEQAKRDAARKRRRQGFDSIIPQLDGSDDFGCSEEAVSSRKKLKLMEGSFLDVERNVPLKPAKKPVKEERKFDEDLNEEVRRRREKILAAYQASREQKEKALAKARAEAELFGEPSCSRPRGRPGAKPHRRNHPGVDLWIEVYCEHEDKWVTIDILSGRVYSLEEIVNQASHPITYVLAWNNDGSIKDVSPRYISRLGSKKSKLRVEDSWLESALHPYRVRRQTRRDRTEDLKFDKLLNKRPFPTQISEYKNHPRFALERYLLRNEAIYPRNAAVLGYIKDEPIYPRDCVHVLFSREGWLRQAKTVKLFEDPYKTVKARARYDRYTGTSITGTFTELFGTWQVQDYEPPIAQNGQVPRSAYGNVDLFKPCMLPKGTVHLQLPGLNKICKRLRIDCAQAITGFEYKSNACQAVYDGFVVCEEFRDQVIDEWYQEQVELERKEDEKVRKRVYGNWRRLVMGLFIRKKLKDRYNFDNM